MDTTDQVRAFNRFYIRQIGLLDSTYRDTSLSLSEARVLYELDEAPGITARKLATALGLDEGYLSRILKRFEKAGWLVRQANTRDARLSDLKLTTSGQGKVADVVRLSRLGVGAALAGKNPIDLYRLTASMTDIKTILTTDEPKIILRDLEPGDIGWLTQQHAELYVRDEGFDHSFEVLVSQILTDFRANRHATGERAFIATRAGVRLGSIFCVRESDDVAKLRLFLLVPQARGLGLGQRLLTACLGFARDTGYQRLVLWTHKSHEAACALYAKNGFRMTHEEPVHEFGQDLIRQNWEIDL